MHERVGRAGLAAAVGAREVVARKVARRRARGREEGLPPLRLDVRVVQEVDFGIQQGQVAVHRERRRDRLRAPDVHRERPRERDVARKRTAGRVRVKRIHSRRRAAEVERAAVLQAHRRVLRERGHGALGRSDREPLLLEVRLHVRHLGLGEEPLVADHLAEPRAHAAMPAAAEIVSLVLVVTERAARLVALRRKDERVGNFVRGRVRRCRVVAKRSILPNHMKQVAVLVVGRAGVRTSMSMCTLSVESL